MGIRIRKVGNWAAFWRDPRLKTPVNPTSLPPMEEFRLAAEERINYVLSLLGDPRAKDVKIDNKEISITDYVSMMKISVFLTQSILAVKRVVRAFPREIFVMLKIEGEPCNPADLYSSFEKNMTSTSDAYYTVISGTRVGLPLIAHPTYLQLMLRHLKTWLTIIYAIRGTLPLYLSDQLPLSRIKDLDQVFSFPDFDTMQVVNVRETGSCDIDVDHVISGRSEIIFYFDTHTDNADVWRNGPIMGTGSHPLFDSFDENGRLNGWSQPRLILRRLQDEVCSKIRQYCKIKTNEIMAELKTPHYWDAKSPLASIRTIPADAVFLTIGCELLTKWCSFIGKLVPNQDVRMCPGLTRYATDVDERSLRNISEACSRGEALSIRSRFNSKEKLQHYANFTNPALVCQNPYICSTRTDLYIKKGTLQAIMVGDKGWAVWKNSMMNAHKMLMALVDRSEVRPASQELHDRVALNELKVICGFGVGLLSSLYLLALVYHDKQYQSVMDDLKSIANRGSVFGAVMYNTLASLNVDGQRAFNKMVATLVADKVSADVFVSRRPRKDEPEQLSGVRAASTSIALAGNKGQQTAFSIGALRAPKKVDYGTDSCDELRDRFLLTTFINS